MAIVLQRTVRWRECSPVSFRCTEMISSSTSRSVVRTVALFEAAKGLLVLLAGFGCLTMLHRDAGEVAEELIERLHLDPTNKYPGIFIDAASTVTDSRLWMWAAFAGIYASFRLVEAFGLWRQRAWAEWLAFAGGAIYLPVEIYSILEKFTWLRVSVLGLNLLVVFFMGQVLWRSIQKRRQLSCGLIRTPSQIHPPKATSH